MAGSGIESAQPRRSTSGSIRQLQAENKSAFGSGDQSGLKLRSRHAERETSDRGLRVFVHHAGHQEMGVSRECGAGSFEGVRGPGGHVTTDQDGSAATVEYGTRGATRHNRDDVDVAVVQR